MIAQSGSRKRVLSINTQFTKRTVHCRIFYAQENEK